MARLAVITIDIVELAPGHKIESAEIDEAVGRQVGAAIASEAVSAAEDIDRAVIAEGPHLVADLVVTEGDILRVY